MPENIREANTSAMAAFGETQSQMSMAIPDRSLRYRFFVKGIANMIAYGTTGPVGILLYGESEARLRAGERMRKPAKNLSEWLIQKSALAPTINAEDFTQELFVDPHFK
jgi:hypothetical protein